MVWRPKRIGGHIRQRVIRAGGHLWQYVHGLRTVVVGQDVFASEGEVRTGLEVLGPFRNGNGGAAGLVVFDRVLIDCGVDQAKIVMTRLLVSVYERGNPGTASLPARR